MKENGKKSTKVATKKSTKVASKDFYFMNVKFEGNESIIRMGETRDVRLKYVDEDNFLATEKAKRVVNGKSQARTTLARTVHGTMSKDDYGFHIGFYIRRDEVRKNAELADILEAEAEEMGNRIVEMEAICN